MFSQFFGNYLLEKDYITSEELQKVLEIQSETRVKLGILAVNMGYMNASEVKKVHNRQAHEDKLFGEIAVELGYMSESELKKVLSMQKKEHHLMAQTLVDEKILTMEELEEAYKGYREENDLTEEEFNALKEGDVEQIVGIFLDFSPEEERELYKKYATLLVKNIVRFITGQLRIKKFKRIKEYSVDKGVFQKIHGDHSFFTAVLADADNFVTFADQYADMKIDSPGELADDSAAEFLNLQNGIFLVNCSDEGIELEMEPQGSLQKETLEFPYKANLITIELDFGEVDFIITARGSEKIV